MANLDHDTIFLPERGSELPSFVGLDDEYISSNSIQAWFNIRSSVFAWMADQSPSESPSVSMVNLEHDSTNSSESSTIRIENSPRALTVAMNIRYVHENASPPPFSTQDSHPAHQNQQESTSIITENSDQDSSVLNRRSEHITISTEEEHTDTKLQEFSNPKNAKYFFGVYSTIIGLLSLKFITEKHSPFHNHIPFMIISVVAYLMATLNLAILFCIYDHLRNSSDRRFSHGNYLAIYYVFHILCLLALFSLMPVLFNPHN